MEVKIPRAARILALSFLFGAAAAPPSTGAEWPQWRGLHRDGVSPETGLLTSWPEAGPPVLWRRPAGTGFSAVTVVGGRLFTLWAEEGYEFIVCLDAATGQEIWRFQADSSFVNERGGGPRSAPTVDGDRLYALTGNGRLFALATEDGRRLWEHDLVEEFGARLPIWGFSSSPPVEGELLLVEAGGDPGKSIVAFHKEDGRLAWTAFTDAPGYSSPLALTAAGHRQMVFVTGQNIVSVSPEGEVLWSHPWPVINNINIATPVLVAEDKIFVSTSYDVGGVLLQIAEASDGLAVREIWRSKVMKNHFQSSVLHEGHLYGFDNATLKSVDANTGQERWRHRGLGKGQLLLVDGRLLILGERGRLVLAAATPESYRELDSAAVLNERCWTPPTLSDGRLYLRTERQILSLDLKGDT